VGGATRGLVMPYERLLNLGRNERCDFDQTYQVIGIAGLIDLSEFDRASRKRDGAARIAPDVQIIDVECSLEAWAGLRNSRANPFRTRFHPILSDGYSRRQGHRGCGNDEPDASRLIRSISNLHLSLSFPEAFSPE